MQKKQKLNKKVISLSLVAGLLAGTNVMTLSAYDYQAKKQVNQLNKINSHNRIQINEKLTEIQSVRDDLFNLNNNLHKQQTEVEQLNETLKSKNDKIHSLEKQLEKATKDNESPSRSSVEVKQTTKTTASTIPSRGQSEDRIQYRMQMTSYTAFCDTGCTGVTATGIDVSNTTKHQGYHVVAVDPSVIPLNSIVRVDTPNGSFQAIAIDTGGAIQGFTIDLLVGSKSEARVNGRQIVTVTVLKEGS